MAEYILIDPPITRFSTAKEIEAWIRELKTRYPQDNEQVVQSIDYAESKLKIAQRKETTQ